MPQLDRAIIFTQIFWLFIVFAVFYTLFIHYFFPTFLKSFKSRTLIIRHYVQESDSAKAVFLYNQNLLNKFFNRGLSSAKTFFLTKLIFFASKPLNTRSLDNKISKFIFNNLIFLNPQILEFIFLESKSFKVHLFIKELR